MRRYDLQVHTDASPCSRATPEAVVERAVERNLDGVAITNHDTLNGVAEAKAAAPASLDVVPGVEVTTTQGHLLALGVAETPPQTDPLSVIDNVHEQGGVAILSHPFDGLRERYSTGLDEIAAATDAVEVLNSRCLLPRFNRRAEEYARRHNLPITGGSDAHFPMEVGRAVTCCEGDVLGAISRGETTVSGRGCYASGHVATKLSDALRLVGV